MSLEQKLVALREKFREDFNAELKKLVTYWQDARVGDSEALKQFHFNVHSIKGSSGALSLTKLSQLMHDMEAVVKPCLEGAPLTADGTTLVDGLMNQLIAASNNNENSFLQLQTDKPEKASIEIKLPSELALPTEQLSYNEINIALVDDDRSVGEMMQKLLAGFSFNVKYYSSLSSFRAELASNGFHLVLLDLIMPDCTEQDVFSCVGELNRLNIKVFILSSIGTFESRLAAVRAQVSDYLLKPVSITHLVTKIRKALKLDLVRPFRVLLLDDQETVCRFYKEVLEKQGCQVVALKEVEQLLNVLESFVPDIFLLDMYMPNASGLEIARVLRQQSKYDYVPILFLTSDNQIKTKLEALSSGADDVITKETSAELIISQVVSRVSRGQEVRYIASRDSLTGTLNHGQIMDAAAHAIRLSTRSTKPLIVVMIDLDKFKSVNDKYGHAGGDKVLMGLGQLLLQSVRQTDFVGRYGGEEFMLVFPDGEMEAVHNKVDAMRDAFSKIIFNVSGSCFHVTLSAGVASSANHQGLSELIAAADAALYEAKDAGRNCIKCEGDLAS